MSNQFGQEVQNLKQHKLNSSLVGFSNQGPPAQNYETERPDLNPYRVGSFSKINLNSNLNQVPLSQTRSSSVNNVQKHVKNQLAKSGSYFE